MPENRGSKGERSREAIIHAVTPVFAEKGYAATSLADLLDAAGVTKGGLYFHFGSKLDLALAVVRAHERRWQAAAMAEAERGERAVDRLFALPRILARMSAAGEGPWALRRLVDELSRDPELRPQVCGSVDVAVATVTGQFREAQAEGSIRPDLDPHRLAEIAVGGFIGLQTLTEQSGDGDLEARVDALIDLVRSATLDRSQDPGDRP